MLHCAQRLKGVSFLPLAAAAYRVIERDDDDTVQLALVAKPNDSELYRRRERQAACRAAG
jgi:lipocalin